MSSGRIETRPQFALRASPAGQLSDSRSGRNFEHAKLKTGKRCGGQRTLFSSIDILATILELAGSRIPPTVDGMSFVPRLTDPGHVGRLYAFAEKNWHAFEDHARAARDVRFKHIRNDCDDLPNTLPADGARSPTYGVMKSLYEDGQLSLSQQG